MRYLHIAAQYTGSALWDDFEGSLEPERLKLPESLCRALRAWNDRYRSILPLNLEERRAPETAALIEGLDREGVELAVRVAMAMGQAKVRYYSEGRLQYLT